MSEATTLPPRTCSTCAYWSTLPLTTEQRMARMAKPSEPEQGLCRRYPPSVVAVPTPTGLALVSQFPTLKSEESCGEHEDLIPIEV